MVVIFSFPFWLFIFIADGHIVRTEAPDLTMADIAVVQAYWFIGRLATHRIHTRIGSKRMVQNANTEIPYIYLLRVLVYTQKIL